MSSSKTPICLRIKIDHFVPIDKPTNFQPNPSKNYTAMWRNIAKLVSSKTPTRYSLNTHSLSRACSFLGFSQDTIFPEKIKFRPSEISSCSNMGFPELGFRRTGELLPRDEFWGKPSYGFLRNQVSVYALCPKSYGSVAEAVSVSSTDVDEDVPIADEIQELLDVMGKEDKREVAFMGRQRRTMERGMSNGKYQTLRRRQVKIETEAWEQAAKEYKELLVDMCEQKLAPNLPYMKSLFLGWFEPLRDKIVAEQELCRQKKHKVAYAPYFDQLPADMMSVITMHKLMGLLMTGGENGSARVVQAACLIGDAIEQEVRIHKFLEKTKKKKVNDNTETEGDSSGTAVHEQDKLRKTVTNLMKKQKLHSVRKIVKKQDDSKPWGQDARAKVGSRLIELLLQTAYIQPRADQLTDGPPDIRPAFVHSLKTVVKEKNISRRYGVIECDPLVRKGLERTVRKLLGAQPYITHKFLKLFHSFLYTCSSTPDQITILRFSFTLLFDKGAHLFLPSYVMRTHGARQQRDVVTRVPRKQLEPVFEALDTLGSNKWRVNNKVLNVVDRIWSSGGRLAHLVDRNDIPLPEKPDTEDEALLRKWRWKVKSVKKDNRERHSQRCDVELKFAVARKMKDEEGFFYPHNLDFRGRAYPMHPYLNHLGSDVCRGILEFAEGRPLGKSGIRWLKIHLANLFAGGVDKLSLEDRIAFTENHLDDIFDSSDQPLEGRRWWLKAEDPFQFLAVCINLSEALRSSSPETTMSHIPVHQDGSCNGLQHYAALGRDKLGATAVNLVAGEKPADVYSGIAARVLDIMRKDAQKDPEVFPDALRARLLINQVDRKLVKQTVMTSVYGVTYIGARDQIKRRLKERNAIADDTELFGAACYAAKITLTALGEMFQAARSIMGWLGDCAKVIIASENEPVQWTTPLGLPVVQPYRKLGRHLVKTSLQVLTLQRETETLLESFQKSFPTLSFPPLPERGDFDLKDVLESPYFFN
ncbi:hypothetical protein TEA_003707 [Camellia sinensis var. sinensis]|uniref:DNA-directed RNA polymerase n=1 Tax=Camellia sinensis var. sinensis TaxID=542762 RepID=A0A4S4DWK3_CAMSN|nr:hypothetical protein TEA_003707 [Camellia sinensis var. sinensis]